MGHELLLPDTQEGIVPFADSGEMGKTLGLEGSHDPIRFT